MIPTLLVIVESDPRTTPRTAEAIRMAAGIGTWKKVRVSLYLRGPAVLALSEYPDELIDEDNFTRYLPILSELGRPIYVQAEAALISKLGEPSAPFEEIEDNTLARMAADSTYVLRF